MTVIKIDPKARFTGAECPGIGMKGWLLLSRDRDGYSLYVNLNTEGHWVCSQVKRLQTLNRYAEPYGIRFETEVPA